jgi:hypothetical protein
VNGHGADHCSLEQNIFLDSKWLIQLRYFIGQKFNQHFVQPHELMELIQNGKKIALKCQTLEKGGYK